MGTRASVCAEVVAARYKGSWVPGVGTGSGEDEMTFLGPVWRVCIPSKIQASQAVLSHT